MSEVIYTDGACYGNPGPGGWAWVREDGVSGGGYEVHTTNQRMETKAVLEAIKAHEGELAIYSDSAYVVNCFQSSWWKGWEARGWRTAKGDAVANQDIWRPLIQLYKDRRMVTFHKVKGHSGIALNEKADQLANEQATKAASIGMGKSDFGQGRLF
ncbi:MAG: ribonuclease HI [Acidimicrobiaceae bacterium]|nr:ribonuclease HI [Acidimicrobiaceae bacterium]